MYNYTVMMLAYRLVFHHFREPDIGDDPSHCHSQFVVLTVRFALERRAGKTLGGPWDVQLPSEADGLWKVFSDCTQGSTQCAC